MTWQRENFSGYFLHTLGNSANSLNTYASYLGRIDRIGPGLDERIAAEGVDAVRRWGSIQSDGAFQNRPSDARSTLNAYLNFVEGGGHGPTLIDMPEDLETEPLARVSIFRLERDLQTAIRADLAALELGLIEADGGQEAITAVGRPDVLATDPRGALVVIELKAGPCPPGAIEQVLGYAQALADERDVRTRAILIAGSFTDRQRAVAKRIPDLLLRTYSFSLRYAPA